MPSNSAPSAGGPYPGGRRYSSYGAFLKEKFGCRVHKIIVDAGFTCPNRDGTAGIGGCSYCNNDAFRPATARRVEPIRQQVEDGIACLRRRYSATKFIVYFQPYSNTFGPLAELVPLYEAAIDHPAVVGIAVGTRPDCMDAAKIAWFESLARSHFVTVEYGLESIHDRTLALINRGHDYACWLDTVGKTRGRGIHLGAHVILGFPWESRNEMLAMAPAVSGVGIDFLKVHHLQIVRGTTLAAQYAVNPFALLDYAGYIDLIVEFLELLDPSICLERLFGLTRDDLLIGPRWDKTKAEIQYEIERALAARGTWQGRLHQTRPSANHDTDRRD